MQRFACAFESSEELVIDGRSLTIEQVVAVARFRRRVRVAGEALARVGRCRVMVDVLLAHREKVYGLTTGFGKLRDKFIEPEQAEALQRNLIRSHACGVGAPFPEEVVRAALLLRLNTLCLGYSGVRVEVLERLVAMLNDDIYPYVPEKGSVGASGDLAPLSHLALFVMGDPGARYYPRASRRDPLLPVEEPRASDFVSFPRLAGSGGGGDGPAWGDVSREEGGARSFEEVARREGWAFRPIELKEKEGLALNNGTQFMTAIACLVIYDASFDLGFAEVAAAMSLEAARGVLDAYRPEIHAARNQSYQAETARRIRAWCKESRILELPYLNTAHLYRAGRIHLRDAQEHLSDLESELEHAGQAIPATVLELRREMSRLAGRLSRLVPVDPASGDVDDSRLAEWATLPAREQIALFNRLLRRVRQDAVALLQSVGQFTFPDGEATPKIKSALVNVVEQLDRVVPTEPLVQDDYSFRCFPQVLACAYRALWHVAEVVEVEINSASDNPLLFPPEPPGGWDGMSLDGYRAWLEASAERIQACRDNTIGGGNFHGEPIAIGMDYLCIALAEVGNISERRIAHLVDENHSAGLPGFLIDSSGLNSGFMIPQYTAAALVSESKVLSHPASVDSIPTCANTEDHVSMGTIAARKAVKVLEHLEYIIAIELLAAYQGLKFREPLLPGKPIRRMIDTLEGLGLRRYDEDRVMYPDMEALRRRLRDRALKEVLVGAIGADRPVNGS